MAVTEIAILHSTSGNLDPELHEKLLAALSTQREWRVKNLPASTLSATTDYAATLFEKVEDNAKVLLTTTWESVEAHQQWLVSDENKAVMGSLSSHIETGDGKNKAVLYHVDAEIFRQPAPPGLIRLLDSPVVSVNRLRIPADKREGFTAGFNERKHLLEDFAKPHMVTGGWRADKEAPDQEDFVLVCGWESIHKHMAFIDTPDFPKFLEKIEEVVTESDLAHFKRRA